MWCDILTKPKQGSVFREFRAHLMNVPKEHDDETEHLLTHHNLLPKGNIPSTLSETDQAVLMKSFCGTTNDKKRRFVFLAFFVVVR